MQKSRTIDSKKSQTASENPQNLSKQKRLNMNAKRSRSGIPNRFGDTLKGIESKIPDIRINGGILKGFKLEFPFIQQKSKTRPTKAIVRESFFNSIGVQIQGVSFIEAFGGSGSMGIEALSHGAKEALFFESNSKNAQILSHNLARAKARCSALQFEVFVQDFFTSSANLAHLQNKSILYLDPPFFVRAGMEDMYVRCFEFIAQLENPHIFLCAFEGMSGAEIPQNLGNFVKIKHKKFGKSTISYFLNTQGESYG